MSFDEQPYSKDDQNLHDACEEIARLRKELAACAKVVEAAFETYRFVPAPDPLGKALSALRAQDRNQ